MKKSIISQKFIFSYFYQNIFLWILFLLLLLPFIAACFYLFPSGDDFKRSLDALFLFDIYGGIKEMLRAWSSWSGRYAHHFFIIFLGDAVTSRLLYALLCLSQFGLYFLGFYLLLKRLIIDNKELIRSLLAGFLFISLLCSYIPLNIPWYEATDFFGIGISNALFLLYVYFLLGIWQTPKNQQVRQKRCLQLLWFYAQPSFFYYAIVL